MNILELFCNLYTSQRIYESFTHLKCNNVVSKAYKSRACGSMSLLD